MAVAKDGEKLSTLAPDALYSCSGYKQVEPQASCMSRRGFKHHTLMQKVSHQLLHYHEGRRYREEITHYREIVLDEDDKDDPRMKKIFEKFNSEGYRVPDVNNF